MNHPQVVNKLIWLSFFVALALTFIPEPLRAWCPNWMLLWVICWTIICPSKIGLAKVAFAGLLVDLITGSLMGAHVISYVVLAVICFRVRPLFMFYPILQQTLLFAMYGLLNAMTLFWLNSLLVHQPLGWDYWWQVLSFAIFWPLVAAFAKEHIQNNLSRHA